jgi:hypothetical protein
VLANTLSCHKQDTGRQKVLEKAYCTQVLLTSDKLDPEITCRLPTELALVLETNSPEASVILTNGYVPLDLIDHILTANKQSPSLEDERAKAMRGDQDWKIQDTCLLYKGRLVVPEDDNPTLPGPPANLLLWLQAWEDGVDDYDHLDSDKPALSRSRTSFFGGGG